MISAPQCSASLGDLHHLVVGETLRRLHLLHVEQRGHLDVVGGRERSQDGEREERKRRQTRKSLLVGASWSLLDLAKSGVFKCFFAQKNFPQSFAVTKSQEVDEK
jgi:hypothetical protein